MTRIQFYSPTTVRVSRDDTERPWLPHVLLPALEIPSDEARLIVAEDDGIIRMRTGKGEEFFAEASSLQFHQHRESRALSIDIPKTEIKIEHDHIDDGIALSLKIQPDEAFYGWGEWFNAFRRTDGTVRLRTRDAIALTQTHETYSAFPFFLSTRGYGFLLLNSHASTWHINRTTQTLDIRADGPGADYIVFYGPAFRDIIKAYTALTGRQPLLPRWAFGLFVTGYPQEHQDTVLERVKEHRARKIPLDGVILDYHWEEKFHNFRWRKSLIPNPGLLLATLQSLGVRLGIITTPFINHRARPFQKRLLNAIARNIPPGLARDDERALDEYADAHGKGLFAHADAKWWFGSGGMVDFTNPDAAQWWNEKMRPLYAQGIAFVKNDDGEYLPNNARSSIGMSGREYHNLYGFFYSRALYDGQAALDDRRPMIYARSVWVGSQRFPAMFLGDQQPTFAHMASTMRAGLNLGLLGFAYWTADVFGLDGKTTPETHMRYAQWALLNPVARYFWRPPHIDDTRFPWSHNTHVENNFRRYTDLRYRLLPYYYALAREAFDTGLPIIRPMLLEFQDDARFADVSDQYMLGDRVLIAPIIEPGATARKIILPRGTWHDFWSNQTYDGNSEIDYAAPLDRLPILIRGGSILPMGEPLQHIPDSHRLDQIDPALLSALPGALRHLR